MVNVVFLLAIAVLVWVLGYRFFARLLAVWIFRFSPKYTVPAGAGQNQDDAPSFFSCGTVLLLAHHFAAIAGANIFVGTGIALIWGWIPAFLWIIVGTSVFSGTYQMASLWLANRNPDHSFASLADRLLGPKARAVFTAGIVVLLAILIADMLYVLVHILIHYPYSVLGFWALCLLAYGFGRFLRAAPPYLWWLFAAGFFVVALLAVAVLSQMSFAFSGALNIDAQGRSFLTLNAFFVWATLLLLYAYFAAKLPISHLLRPQGSLSAALMFFMLIVFYICVLLGHKTVSAPGFHHAGGAPSTLPSLFFWLVGGAIAGVQGLVAGALTAKQIKRESHIMPMGYGAAVLQGSLALSVVIAGIVGFANADGWKQHYSAWPQTMSDVMQYFFFYIEGVAAQFEATGLEIMHMRSFVAAIAASLIFASLMASLRVLNDVAGKALKVYLAPRFDTVPFGRYIALLAVLIAFLAINTSLLPLSSALNSMLAGFVFLMAALLLRRLGRNIYIPLGFAIVFLIIPAWALLVWLVEWFEFENWPPFYAGIVLFIVLIALVILSVRKLKPHSH